MPPPFHRLVRPGPPAWRRGSGPPQVRVEALSSFDGANRGEYAKSGKAVAVASRRAALLASAD